MVPNILEFGDIKKGGFSSRGYMEDVYTITVYGKLSPNQENLFYQKKIDSLYSNYVFSIHSDPEYLNYKEPDNKVIFIKKNVIKTIKYNLIIRKTPTKETYKTRFKQNYYSYEKAIKGNFPNSEYLKGFSKLNFGKAKFVAQPMIEDSLFINISK